MSYLIARSVTNNECPCKRWLSMIGLPTDPLPALCRCQHADAGSRAVRGRKSVPVEHQVRENPADRRLPGPVDGGHLRLLHTRRPGRPSRQQDERQRSGAGASYPGSYRVGSRSVPDSVQAGQGWRAGRPALVVGGGAAPGCWLGAAGAAGCGGAAASGRGLSRAKRRGDDAGGVPAGRGAVSLHDIAAIWVAFFSR